MDQLKDVILSTLAEIQEIPIEEEKQKKDFSKKEEMDIKEESQEEKDISQERKLKETNLKPSDDELLFLESLRERFLVLFEGFQAPNNAALEAKVDLTLNFMEYVLATLETRIETIKGK